jgi:hypothetical protein
MDATTNLGLPFIMAAQAQKHVTHNEALRALDAVVQLAVLDKDLDIPPGSPAEGACYIVGAGPGGAWAGQAASIAAYQDAAWAFYPPREGWLAWVADEDSLYVWNGAAWAPCAGGLASVAEDTAPQLGGDLDGNGHSIAFDDGTGITDDAGNALIVFHKAAGAVNQVGLANAPAGSAPQIAAEGADTDIDLTLVGKGAGHPKAALLGVNATADATTRFVVAAAASLFDHAGSGHQHKINKNAAGDTASLLFQTGSSGRAEMGTAGDDDFHFKVSADGSTWKEAIVIDKSTGVVSLPLTPKREVLSANRTYYVRTDGSDGNDGLADTAGGAFLTIQKAIDVAAALDLAVFSVTIQVGAGTYTAGIVLKSYLGAGPIAIVGDETTPGNVLISATSANCFTADTVAGKWQLKGMKLQTTTSGMGIFAANGSIVEFQNIDFGAAAAHHMYAGGRAALTATGNYAVTGGANSHMNANFGGFISVSGRTVTLTGTPAFTYFAYCTDGSGMYLFSNTYSGAATGIRYAVSMLSYIDTLGGGATYLPGDAAGSEATNGKYA